MALLLISAPLSFVLYNTLLTLKNPKQDSERFTSPTHVRSKQKVPYLLTRRGCVLLGHHACLLSFLYLNTVHSVHCLKSYCQMIIWPKVPSFVCFKDQVFQRKVQRDFETENIRIKERCEFCLMCGKRWFESVEVELDRSMRYM